VTELDRERWQKIESLFHGALERPAAVRSAYLDEASAGDRAVRDAVVAMLAEHETDPSFLDPIVDLSAAGTRDAAVETKRVGAYRVVREIGAGGMGVVYLAMHEGAGFERAVALKVIRRGLDTEDVLRRFQLERRILAGLRHPNVANLIDAGQTDDGRPFLVMDFVEGVALDAYCEREKLSVPKRLALFQQVCDAVQHAHNNLVVHRDIKPSNILVTVAGAPILLDFGISKLIDPLEVAGEKSTTRTGARAFTPEYAAPEQISGQPVSTATDVYGLGVLLYKLLAGRRPFSPENGFSFEKAVLETEPPKPSSFGGRELAGDLDTIILKALRKEPDRRYSSVSAFSDDIQRYLDGLPVRARADTIGYVTGKFVRRHRLWLSAAAIAFVSLIGATIYSAAQARAVARERDKALEVQRFLIEMFGAGGRERGDTVSIRQLLDGQAALVSSTYASRPELHAQMLAVIAEGYDRLGMFKEAEPSAREALALRRGVLRPDHPDIASITSLLGWILYEQGKAGPADTLLREALDLWKRARPANPLGEARTLNDFGVVREAAGKYDEAGDLYRRALTTRRLMLGDNDRAVATTGSNLSVVLYRKGDVKGAVVVAESALAVMRNVSGPDHQRSTLIQSNLAAFRTALGDTKGAEVEYRDLIDRQSRVLGRKHPQTAGTINGLASALRRQQRYVEAESLFREAMTTFEGALGKEHARVANTAIQLGGVLSSQKKFREARPLMERALAIQRKIRGDTHRDVALAMTELATLSGDAGDWAGAERGHRAALDVWERSLGPKHVEVATARTRLARTLLMRGKPDQALALYVAAHEAMVAGGVTGKVLSETQRLVDSLRASIK
jgi:tetratricopeptide (TPR) repeat protein/predicted Ser/Thr protein kinase